MYIYIYIITLNISPVLPLQLTLPLSIAPRRDHSAVVLGCGPGHRVVVLFGGVSPSGDVIAETTILFLGGYG